MKLLLKKACACGKAGAQIEAGESYARRLIACGVATPCKETRRSAKAKAAKGE